MPDKTQQEKDAEAKAAKMADPTPVAIVPAPVTPPAAAKTAETAPGGKFGVKDVVRQDDGSVKEEVKWVNAHGLPYTDDPDENTKAELKDRRDLNKNNPK